MITGGKDIQPDGSKTGIHYAILELLAAADLTGGEFRCLLFILRKTYGWQKKSDALSYGQIATATGLSRRGVINSIQSLIAKRMLIASDATIGRNGSRVYSFNKYFEQWCPTVVNGEPQFTIYANGNSEPECTISEEMVNRSSLEIVNQSAPIEPEIVNQSAPTILSNNTKNNSSSKREKVDHASVGESSDDGKQPTDQQQYFGAVCILVGIDYRIITKEQTGQVAQTVGKLRKAGYSLDDLRAFWHYWKHDDWRGKQGQWPTLKQLLAEIGKVKMAGVTLGGEMSTNGNGGMMSPVFNGSEK